MKAPSYKEIYNLRKAVFADWGYSFVHWSEYDFTRLKKIMYRYRPGRGENVSFNDAVIMFDTETSKKKDGTKNNHVVAWTISIRAFDMNIVTLWGQKPYDLVSVIDMLHDIMPGDKTIIYAHNLSYDWQFVRKFMFDGWGYPLKQLNTKPHYPISIEFENGLILRDSLILAQRSLDRWAKDLNAEHQKACGKWDYDRIRNQSDELNADELEYIEHDTLAGVECLDILRHQLNKQVYSMPYTATGIVREDVRKIGKKNRGNNLFQSAVPDYELYKIMEYTFHGGYTHANRHEINYVNQATCYDFASDYPACMLMKKFPMERFMSVNDCGIDTIINNMEDNAYIFKLIMIRPRLKNGNDPMPALQSYKCFYKINPVIDNGRILQADEIEIYLTDIDLKVIIDRYDFDKAYCTEVYAAYKTYLPRWLTDYVYSLFEAKTMLKGGDKVLYNLSKAKLNSCFGMCCQRSIAADIIEEYESGEFNYISSDLEEKYQKYTESHTHVLLYQWGIYITAYAFQRIYELGSCISGQWLYSDTDSAYATEWDQAALDQYNQRTRSELLAAGYGPVIKDGREYWLGVAEFDGQYSEFISQGAKRYACRDMEGKLKITVAGVPKSGVECLHDDIRNFKKGLIFDGLTTGKLTHEYIYTDKIYIDDQGNETGDSVNLTPCDYLLDSVYKVDWDKINYQDIYIQVYDE